MERPSKATSSAIDFLLFAALFFAALKNTFFVEYFRDIRLWDESIYLYRGTTWLKNWPMSKGAIYSVWYGLLSLVIKNRLSLYYFNYQLLIALSTSVLYCFSRTVGLVPILALFASWIYLLSAIPLFHPHAPLFLLAMILCLLAIASKIKAEKNLWLIFSSTSLLLMFVRLEYSVTFLLAWVLLARAVLKSPYPVLMSSGRLILPLGLFFTLCALLGNPFDKREAWLAFGQHFARYYLGRYPLDISPWHDFQIVMASTFGQADTIWAAAQQNPSEFMGHVWNNIESYPRQFFSLLFLHKISNNQASYPLAPLIVSSSVLMLIYLISKRIRIGFTARALQMGVLVLLPSFLTAVIFGPDEYYLNIQAVAVLLLPFWLLSRILSECEIPLGSRLIPSALIGAAVFFLTPFRGNHQLFWPSPPWHLIEQPSEMPVRNVIDRIKSLGIQERVNMLEMAGGYAWYLPANYSFVIASRKDGPFNQYILKQKVNMILVTRPMLLSSKYSGDPEFLDFLKRFQEEGFVQIDIPVAGTQLYVKKSLMPSEAFSARR